MLKRFEVQGFKGFKKLLTLDLSAREYEFNKNLTKNNIVNKAFVYGKNGVGKSCLGIALFDIVYHLTDKEQMSSSYLRNYLNLETSCHHAIFRYTFLFEDEEVVYEYKKKNPNELLSEKVSINGKTVIDYDFFDKNKQFIDNIIIGSLNVELVDNKLSVVKYIYRNTPTNSIPLITKMVGFCEKMLWYRSLSDGNTYAGFTNGGASLSETLYKHHKINEFQEFLRENGLKYDLKFVENNGDHELMAQFNGGKLANFNTLASTGTMALFLFYIWSISAFNDISFLFIDEFDAFLHYESAANIVSILNKANGFQTILTSHNTYLMQNKFTRPDCCFIMTTNKITSLYNATDKEIREAHNLEKMYINGAFNE